MNAYLFSVFKRSNRLFFSVSFKDASGRYLSAVSTRKPTETEAIQVAFQWLCDGIPQKKAALSVSKLALKDFARQIETIEDAELVLNVLKTHTLVKSFVLPDARKAVDFIYFLSDFWDWDTSAYVREKRCKKHSLHQYHCKRMKSSVEHYWKPVFQAGCLVRLPVRTLTHSRKALRNKI
jgi:hypothetical protein